MEKLHLFLRLCGTWAVSRLQLWIKLRTKKEGEEKQAKELIGLLLDVIFAFVFGAIPMPVDLRWLLWLICFIFAGIIVCNVGILRRFPARTKSLICVSATLLFVLGMHPVFQKQWREEKAALTEGDISAKGKSQGGDFILEIGPGGTAFGVNADPNNDEVLGVMKDAGIHIRNGEHGPKISTQIRNSNDDLIVEIVDNHWTVYPPYCSDKNYDDQGLEVKDSGGHVVLQVDLFPDRVELQGEWRDKFGHGWKLMKSLDPKMPGSMFYPWNDKEQEERMELPFIPPVFRYPSSQYWGQRVRPPE